jgi:hypothetical protein
MPRLQLCCRASPSFLVVAALPSLLVRHPCALPSWQMACACALLSAHVFLPCGFAVTARATLLCFAVTSDGKRSHFVVSSRSSLLPLCCCCACITLVHLHCSKWVALALCCQLASFALAECSCFAIAANGSCLHFAISLRSAPLRLCRCCSCVALVLHHRSKWLALALCC